MREFYMRIYIETESIWQESWQKETYLGKKGCQQSEKSGVEGGLYMNSNDTTHENVNEIHYFVY